MGLAVVPGEASGHESLGEDGLAQRQTGQADRVKGAEGVEGITFVTGPMAGGVHKAEIEGGVVSHQDGTLAPAALDGLANRIEYLMQRFQFRQGTPEGMVGIDAIEGEGLGVETGIGEGFDMTSVGRQRHQETLAVHLQDHHGNLQQGVLPGIKPPGFDIHHHRQIAPETPGNHRFSLEFVVLHQCAI